MLPEAIVMACVMPVAGVLYDAVGPRLPAALGLAITACGTYLLCGINADVPLSDIVLWTGIRAIGTGLALMAIMTGGLMSLPAEKRNEAGAINTVVQRVSSALGLGVLSTFATSQTAQLMADRSGLVPWTHANTFAGLLPAHESGRLALYGLYQRLRTDVVASAYSAVFLLVTATTVIGAVLALTLRRPPSALSMLPTADDPAQSSRTGRP
jgi:hypothetical protein